MPRLRLPWTFDGKPTELDAGYAYLLHSGVRMPELYPLLGELLFASKVVSANGEDPNPANLIGMFVEDKQELLFRHLVDEIPAKGATAAFRSWLSANGLPTPVAAWFHTFGEFSEYTGSSLSCLDEGVMDEREASYLESFFDGIFRIEPWPDPKVQHGSGIRLVSVLTEALPLQETLPPPFIYRPFPSTGSLDHPSLKSLEWRPSRFTSMVQRPRTKRWWRRCGQYPKNA